MYEMPGGSHLSKVLRVSEVLRFSDFRCVGDLRELRICWILCVLPKDSRTSEVLRLSETLRFSDFKVLRDSRSF